MPFLSPRYGLNFYGGEPLLCFDLIEQTVGLLTKKNPKFDKKPRYSLTTNGSLLTDEIIQFLGKHRFSVVFSFDGLAQDSQRQSGSFSKLVSLIAELLKCRTIRLETNSVFTPGSVSCLSDSVRFIMDLGIRDINFSLSLLEPWDEHSLWELKAEMKKLNKVLIAHFKKEGHIPVVNFREAKKRGIFYCAAGQDRLALTPVGNIWGCDLFADYFQGCEGSPEYRRFHFGNLDTFMSTFEKVYPRISKNYVMLSMDNFSSPHLKCLFCAELENCFMCPVNAAFHSGHLGEIPQFACEIQRIKTREKAKFAKVWRKVSARFNS